MKRLMVGLVVATMLVAMVAVPAMALTSKVLVAGVSPDGGSANVGADSNITATFNIRMAKSTINNKTFYLKQDGSTAVVPAQVAYTGTTKTATLKPNNDLASGATYTAYVKGGRTGVRGTGGQKLGGTTDTTATFANAKVSWTFTVATPPPPPPETTIDSGPSSLVNSHSASFSFSSSEASSSFECSLDEAPFEPCTSPITVPDEGLLVDGVHTLRVRAINALGNADPTPDSWTWKVDTVAPAAPSARLDASSNSGSQNDDITNDNTPTISGTAEAGSTVKIYNAQNTFVASIAVGNAGTWSHTFGALQDGTYSYLVKATDAAGNESQGSPISLTVDTAAPETTLGDKPASPLNSASATFTFSSSESGSSFECSLDGSPFAGCTSPKEYTGLADGSHTFRVRATEVAGNADSTPATHTWTVETAAPTITNFSPANTEMHVALSTNVKATFSEAMNSSSISTQTFTLTPQGSSDAVPAMVSYNSTTRRATLNPSTDLALNTTYTATLTTGVKDLAGNALAQERSWTFTTGDGTYNVTVTPATLAFSSTNLCPIPPEQYLEVKNNGPGNVTFAAVSITGPDAFNFRSGAKSYLAANEPFTVLAGNHFFDEIIFVPAGGSRTYSATLTYKDNNGATIGNPVTLAATTQCIVVG